MSFVRRVEEAIAGSSVESEVECGGRQCFVLRERGQRESHGGSAKAGTLVYYYYWFTAVPHQCIASINA